MEIVNRKIEEKHAIPRMSGQRRLAIGVQKSGRLIQIDFSVKSEEVGKGRAFLTFTEAEVLMLASLCRRERSDEAFLKAINLAGGQAAPRKIFRRLASTINEPEEDI